MTIVPTERIRGRARVAIRARILSNNPLCVMCEAKGRPTVATQVDHIIALVHGGAESDDNRQGLCDDCHRDKTANDMGWQVRPLIGADGWPV